MGPVVVVVVEEICEGLASLFFVVMPWTSRMNKLLTGVLPVRLRDIYLRRGPVCTTRWTSSPGTEAQVRLRPSAHLRAMGRLAYPRMVLAPRGTPLPMICRVGMRWLSARKATAPSRRASPAPRQ